jgi:4-hydroxy-4-methyl-2-oxoglutarate aldolase
MPKSLLTEEQLSILQQVDSPTIANVIELFDIRSRVAGFANHSIKAVYPELPPAVGYAVTATFRSAYPAEGGDAYGGLPQLVEDSMRIPEPRIVVFQDLDEPPSAATYGEVMATTFQSFGFTGLITSGAARDMEQVRKMRFPCWASSVNVSHGYCHFLASNVPVVVGGLQIKPGDLLHADANGIVSIPHSIAAEVVELCHPFMEAEQVVIDYLRSGKATPEGFRQLIDSMSKRFGELRERARGFKKARQ